MKDDQIIQIILAITGLMRLVQTAAPRHQLLIDLLHRTQAQGGLTDADVADLQERARKAIFSQ